MPYTRMEFLDSPTVRPSDEAVAAILRVASLMVEQKIGKMSLRTGGYYLTVRTQFARVSLEHEPGLLFNVAYSVKEGRGSAKFILFSADSRKANAADKAAKDGIDPVRSASPSRPN